MIAKVPCRQTNAAPGRGQQAGGGGRGRPVAAGRPSGEAGRRAAPLGAVNTLRPILVAPGRLAPTNAHAARRWLATSSEAPGHSHSEKPSSTKFWSRPEIKGAQILFKHHFENGYDRKLQRTFRNNLQNLTATCFNYYFNVFVVVFFRV